MMRDGQIIYEGAWDKEQGDLEQLYMEEFE